MAQESRGQGDSGVLSVPTTDAAQRLLELWSKGPEPDVRLFLAGQDGLSPSQAVVILCVDQRERWTRGQRKQVED